MLGPGGQGRCRFACDKYVNKVICSKRMDRGELKSVTILKTFYLSLPLNLGVSSDYLEQQSIAGDVLCHFLCLGFKTLAGLYPVSQNTCI